MIHDALKSNDTQRIAELGFGNVSTDILDILALGLTDAKPIDLSILNRLVPAQEDNEAIIKQRYKNYTDGIAQVEELLRDNLVELPTYDYTISKLFDELAKKLVTK